MTPIPVLETERLLLRGWKEDDLDAFARMSADPEVMRFIGGSALSRNDAWRLMAAFIGHWVLRGFGFWVVERKSDGVFVGRGGLWQPEGWPGMELGWALDRPFWGLGYATEAAKAALDYGFERYPVPRLLSLIVDENHASQRVAERLGETRGPAMALTILGRTFHPHCWEISRERWRPD